MPRALRQGRKRKRLLRKRSRTSPVPSLLTEQRNPASREIDALNTVEILETILAQDSVVPAAVAGEIPTIAEAVEAVVRALRRGGRLIYVGAGTSGRIGVMDAAECPPTFGVSPKVVQAVIAGGPSALTEATEAAEDDEQQARRDLAARKVGPRDVVIGLAASGRTPYTVAALRYARSLRATTVAVTCNPDSPITRVARISIVPATGPEVLAGSTRMKAALAQKMVLHMISTAAMIRLGNVYYNYMIGVRPSNEKLWERACAMIEAIAGVGRPAADKSLRQANKDVKLALVMLRTGLDRTAAARLLARCGGNLRKVL
ncbi:MAG: N-acetylmuramic acid 6-phosphate etherase [Acidobacteria bacterium]|nr:N-acetylmuramic acid 6-phosphate etherase [Acidobacteriota bacterium]